MDDVILYNFQPSLEDLLKQLHFEADSEQADIAEELLEEAVEIASPKTLLKVLPVTVNEQSVSIGNVEITVFRRQAVFLQQRQKLFHQSPQKSGIFRIS